MKPSNDRQQIQSSLLTLLSVLFGLQLIRVLLPLFAYYLRDSKGVSAINLAPIALGVFILSFLAAPLRRLAGQRGALVITAGGVALFRAAEQLSSNSDLDLIFAAAGVALFAMFIPIALEIARPGRAGETGRFGLALLLGVAADTAIHAGASTLDLSWQPGWVATVVILLLAIAALVLLWLMSKAPKPEKPESWGWARILALAAYGPWLFLQLVIFQNVARMGAITGWSIPVAGLVICLGNVIGLVAAAHAPRAKQIPGSTIFVGLAFILMLFLAGIDGFLGGIITVVGQVLSFSLLATIFFALGSWAKETGRMGAPAANGIGQLLFVIIIFVFYVSYDMAIGFRAPAILPVAAVLVAVAAFGVTRGLKTSKNVSTEIRPVIVAALLLLLPAILLITWDTLQPSAPPAGNNTIRIMDYNLHNGFNTDGQLDLEALAQVIEANDADVIGLQEVSRGWVINGSVDMLQWLSQRLDMPYIFGPTEGLLWGNAILSRYPIVNVETASLPPESQRLRRGYIKVEVEAGQRTIHLIDTHLHHLEPDSEMRQEQVPFLVEAWGGAPRTILVGDMNATPDSPEMQMLAGAGLVDVGGVLGPDPGYTFYSPAPDSRIDYIWTSPDIVPTSFDIPQTTASDHLPLVTTIVLP
jgi:endonuclease/exonuclease/phosphatase family metal-dependent hydrolase